MVVVTGLSGAGRSTALNALEDLGFYCVDNLPPSLIGGFTDLQTAQGALRRMALGLDMRTGDFVESFHTILETFRSAGYRVDVMFVEASDGALVNRFNETRRSHPLAHQGNLLSAIMRERASLSSLRERATVVFDTSHWSKHDLRRSVVDHISRSSTGHMRIRVLSFGFKYGIPMDADLVFDVRFLPNPHFVPELKPKTGLDQEVLQFVMDIPQTATLLDDLKRLLDHTVPQYRREGKAYLTIAVGCTGGRHRSVAIGRQLASIMEDDGITVEHRDLHR